MALKRRRVIGVVLGLSALVALSGLPAGASSEPTVPPERVKDAVRFRSDFGLDTAPSRVAASFNDPAYVDTEWGVPLSRAERDELARRSRVREAVQPALELAMKSPTYAGAYIDQQRRGLPVFASTDPVGLKAQLQEAVPSDVAVEIKGAAYTATDLERLQDSVTSAIPAFAAEGVTLVSAGLDDVRNRVAVGIHGLTPAVADRVAQSFGTGVYVYEQSPATNDTCAHMGYCWPMKGGLLMFAVGEAPRCTTGFLGRRTDTAAMVMVTAGHCLAPSVTASTEWGHAQSPEAAKNWGWELGETWTNPPAGHTYARADIGLIQLRSTATSALGPRNYVHTSDPSSNEGIRAVTDHAYQLTGDNVCRMGYGTWDAYGQGKTCGKVGRRDVTNLSCESGLTGNCRYIMHTWEVTFDSLPGDSGGPVYHNVYAQPPYITAYGTHVHSGSGTGAIGWYSPINLGRNAYDLLPFAYGYTVCVTSTC